MLKTRASRENWLFWMVALLVIGAGLGLRDPWPADEPRFALVAKQMVESGNWLFPHRGVELYSDKPPMLMWLQAAAYQLLRDWRIAFLLPSLLASLGTLWCVVDLGRRLWTRRVGLYAGWALLFALQFTYQAKKAQIDPLVVFWITLACYGLLRHVMRGPDWRMWMLGWAAAGLGTITKGVGVIALLLLLPASHNPQHLMLLSIFWGVAIMIIGLGMQVKVLASAPDATDVAMSLFSGIFNIGIGAGALVGSQVSLHLSMASIGYIGAIPALAGLIWALLIFRRWPVSLEEHQPHHS